MLSRPYFVHTLSLACCTSLALTILPAPVQADPFDGFFTGAQPADSTRDVRDMFNRLSGSTPAGRAAHLAQATDTQVVAMRLTGDLWWAAETSVRSDLVDALGAFIGNRLEELQITAIDIVEIAAGNSSGEYIATGQIDSSVKGRFDVTWTIRMSGTKPRLIGLDADSRSLFLTTQAHDYLDAEGATIPGLVELMK